MTITDTDWVPGLDERDLQTRTLPAGIHHRAEDGKTFVVVSGRAMVEFEELDSLVFLRRGSLCRLPSAARTRWTVSEPIEYLLVTEASVVFKQHDDEPARSGTDVNQARSVRPFRPRRYVS
jgi:mannose-6-phosphate isomerase-like protein (cupin superfamily)